MTGYILDQTWELESDRLAALEGCCDPLTTAHLERLGVGPGWRCLEVGAGRGSITRWLAARAGATGSVLAVDLDTTLVEPLRGPTVEVRRLDILRDRLPAGAFDVVHARHVLGHLPERATALRRLAAALRPGGRLLLEDFDFRWPQLGDWPCDPPEVGGLVARVWGATLEVMRAGGYDGAWAWRLPAEMRAAGLADVAGEARNAVGDAAFADCCRLTVLRFRDRIVAAGLMSGAEVDECLAALADPRVRVTAAPLVSVWGTRSG